MHADCIYQQDEGIQSLYILNGRFKMTPDCFNIDMHVLPVESCIYALCMIMLSDQIGELQH